MKKLTLIGIFCGIVYLLTGCGKTDAVTNKETVPQQSESITVVVDSPTEVPADNITGKLSLTPTPEPITTEEPAPSSKHEPIATEEPLFYDITIGDFGDYNIVFEINGYLYRFHTEMNSDDIELIVEPKTEEERYGSKIMVNPVFVTNGEKTEQLGIVHGYQFDIRSDKWVQPHYLEENKLCGKIVSVDKKEISFCLAEEIDRDTYVEFVNISEEKTYFEFSEDIEYVIHDINMRATEVTYERFMEHLSRNPDMVYYLFERGGKVVQVWEPYIP